ncbi:MAG: hypothetical protein WAK53_04055 [Chromatiaceae bacterium]|jgi:hypothetical protein
MFFPVPEADRRLAKSPHELAMVNLLLFNLLIGIALLAGSMAQPDSVIARYKWLAVSVPLLTSLAVIAYTWLRAARARATSPWFVAAHWRLSAGRYKGLLAAYVVCAALLSLAFFGGVDEAAIEAQIKDLPPAMQAMERGKLHSQHMGEQVWARIAVVPLLLTVMATIMLESGSIYQAQRGEVPGGVVERFPPPPDLKGSETEIIRDSPPTETEGPTSP